MPSELALTSHQVNAEKERRRLQHVLQQVSEEKIVAKLLEHLSSGIANAALLTLLAQVFDKIRTPSPKKLSTCTRCGEWYDPNSLESKNSCQLEHQVTKVAQLGGSVISGQEWSREWDDRVEGDVGWCYEGPHHDSDTSD